MIARHGELQHQQSQIQAWLGEGGPIQKIFSTSRYISFQVRRPSQSRFLYFGRGGGFEGFWCGVKAPVSSLRTKDVFLEYLRKFLTGAILLRVNVDELDRIVSLETMKWGKKFCFAFFWCGRDLYFAHDLIGEEDVSEEGVYVSWKGKILHETFSFSLFDQVGRKPDDETHREVRPSSIEKLLEDESKVIGKNQLKVARPDKIKRKVLAIEEDLRKISQWKPLQDKLAQLDPLILESKDKYEFSGLVYKFTKGLNAHQKKNELFQWSKRLKLAQEIQKKRLDEARVLLEQVASAPIVVKNPLKPAPPIWRIGKEEKSFQTPKTTGEYKIFSFDGFKIGVGLSSQGNDELRKVFASDKDTWVHAAHGTSAHAIIKSANGVVAPEMINQAALIVSNQSGNLASELEIIFTQVKNVKGVTGKPGMVTYKKQKTMLCKIK